MKLSSASQLILFLSLPCLIQVNAKGLKGRAKQQRNLQVNQKGLKGNQKAKLSDKRDQFVVASTTPMDREETAFANNEFGETLYVPINVDDNEETEGFWDFSDLDDEDREDLEPSDFVIEVGDPNDGEEATEEESEETTNSTTDVASVVGEIFNDFFAEENNLSDAELHEIALEAANNMPQLEGVYVHKDPDLKEDLEKLEEEESELIVNDTPTDEWASDTSKLAARITEAEIQLDTLLQLNNKVADMQVRLDRALAIIEEQKNAINTLATMLKPASDATTSNTDP